MTDSVAITTLLDQAASLHADEDIIAFLEEHKKTPGLRFICELALDSHINLFADDDQLPSIESLGIDVDIDGIKLNHELLETDKAGTEFGLIVMFHQHANSLDLTQLWVNLHVVKRAIVEYPQYQDIYNRIVSQDLKCGITIDHFNAVFTDTPINPFRLMEVSDTKPDDISFPVYVDDTIDGQRAAIMIHPEGKAVIRDENGKRIHHQSITDDAVSFYGIIKEKNLMVDGAIIDGYIKDDKFIAVDCLGAYTLLSHGVDIRNLQVRRQVFTHLSKCEHIRKADYMFVFDQSMLDMVIEMKKEAGQDVIIKPADGDYTNKFQSSWFTL